MGKKLIADLAEATGLPKSYAENELEALIQKSGLGEKTLTLDDLRVVLADYMQDVLLEAKEKYSKAPQKKIG